MLPNTIGFKDLRVFGENAVSLLSKDPESVIELNQRAIGASSPIFERLKNEYSTSPKFVNEQGVVIYKIKDLIFTAEEILAQQLEFIKGLAQKHTVVEDCVLTIPSFFTQIQRRNLISAAKAAKFNVIGLVPENTAAALYYGLERYDEKPVFVIFYNVGASYIQGSLVKYSLAKSSASKLSDKKHENIEVVHQSWNQEFGGRTIDAYIADYISEKFIEKHSEDPRLNIKAKTRLIQEGNKIKKILSANKVANSVLPSLINGIDFEVKIERALIDDFVLKNSQVFLKPIQELLESSNKTISEISFIETIGGVVRVPSIDKLISDSFIETSSHLNGDESMANGAALFGANFSSQVQIKQLWLSDFLPYSVKAEIKTLPNGPSRVKELFSSKSHLGSTKKIAISSDDDLEITIFSKYHNKYEENVKYFVRNIKELKESHENSPNFVLSFVIDLNGIAKLDEIEARFEKNSKKIKINFSEVLTESPHVLTEAEVLEISQKLEKLSISEKNLKKKIEIQNDFESFIYDIKERLLGPEFQKVIAPVDQELLNKLLNDSIIYLGENNLDTLSVEKMNDFKEKINEFVEPASKKEEEFIKREESVLNAFIQLKELKNEVFALDVTEKVEEEKQKVLFIIDETINWLEEKNSQQEKHHEWLDPVLKLSEIEEKLVYAEKKVTNLKRSKSKKQDL